MRRIRFPEIIRDEAKKVKIFKLENIERRCMKENKGLHEVVTLLLKSGAKIFTSLQYCRQLTANVNVSPMQQ